MEMQKRKPRMPRGGWAAIVRRAEADGRIESDAAPAARSLARQIDRLEACFARVYAAEQGQEERKLTPDWLEKMGKAEKLLCELNERLSDRLAGGGRLVVEGFLPPPLQEGEGGDAL